MPSGSTPALGVLSLGIFLSKSERVWSNTHSRGTHAGLQLGCGGTVAGLWRGYGGAMVGFEVEDSMVG